MGVAAVREQARLRLKRVPFIGVDRAALRARGTQRHRTVVGHWEDGTRRDDFYAMQSLGALAAASLGGARAAGAA